MAPTPLELTDLLRANRQILGERALPDVLRRVIESACRLTHARYGALGVIGPDGRLDQFVHVGMEPDTVTAIGELPKGGGLLGALIEHPTPICLRTIAADPRSSGFPPNHPPMDSFLGVPIVLRDQVYGNLYLTESEAGEFTEQDVEMAQSLAGTAAIAIENTRLFHDAERRQDWLQASTEVTRRMLSPQHHDALRDIAEQVMTMADADVVTVVLPTGDGSRLRIAAATGPGSAELTGVTYLAAGTLSQAAIDTSAPIRLANAADAAELDVHLREVIPIGPVIALPLAGADRIRGALIAGRLPHRAVFSLAELDMAATFAGHAGVALELADAREAQERVRLLEDRDRIAQDLHDHVIQRLFATGLTVQSSIAGAAPAATERLSRVVDEIDTTIRQIRTTIFALQNSAKEGGSPREQLLRTVNESGSALTTPPAVRFAGPIDTTLTPVLVQHGQAVLRESLTNVARHAGATSVTVIIRVENDCFTIEVADDGVGIGGSTRRSGLANLSSRAAGLGGRFQLTDAAPTAHGDHQKGTHLLWTVPLK